MNRISRDNLKKLPHRYQVLFAIFCAEQVIHLVKPEHLEVCRAAIDAAKGFVSGEVTAEECRVAADNAWSATGYTASYAAYAADAAWAAASTTYACWAADYAAYAAAYAAAGAAAGAADAARAAYAAAGAAAYATDATWAYATDAAKDKIVEQQWSYYHELLNLDSNLEKALVGGVNAESLYKRNEKMD